MTEQIQINDPAVNGGYGNLSWWPKHGPEVDAFLQTIGRPQSVQDRLLSESSAILGGCINPKVGGRSTGLVLGRVQSGKTSSFTAVSALAHDNGYKLVVVIAGTNHLLVDQTTERLVTDLRLLEKDAFQRWTVCRISSRDSAKASAAVLDLKARLRAVATAEKQLYKGIPLVVVMKNKTHLDKLNSILSESWQIEGVDPSNIPALIIDDEAHMYSPDVGKEGRPSAIYECLKRLYGNFKNCSLLQYTATPQANLLMEIADEMSPDFVRILEPGAGYVGGRELFESLPSPRVRDIPISEHLANPDKKDKAPPSLVSAMANFTLLCAIDYHISGEVSQRSMLVHSDAKVGVHDVYEHWMETLRDSWTHLLSDIKNDIPIEFKRELDDLRVTRTDIDASQLSLEAIREILVLVLKALRIQSVNHRKDVGKVDYNLAPYWIVNGGNILGVGYTVNGLVTTHMIRRSGAGMADTIQQRGRFFGYMGDRIDSIRIFITSEMARMFKEYSDHEESLRSSLMKYDASSSEYDSANRPTLKDWKRVFWLDPAMIPCRKNAQRLMLERAAIDAEGWVTQRDVSPSTESDNQNLTLVSGLDNFVTLNTPGGWKVSDYWGGEPGNNSTTHLEAEIPLQRLIEFMSSLTLSSTDLVSFNAAQLVIENLTDDLAAETASIFFMAKGSDRSYVRKRSIENRGLDLFQGKGDGKGPGLYVGDRKVRSEGKISLQVHVLNVFAEKDHAGLPLRSNATAIALCMPTKYSSKMKKIIQQK